MGTGTVYSTHGMNDDGTLKRDSINLCLNRDITLKRGPLPCILRVNWIVIRIFYCGIFFYRITVCKLRDSPSEYIFVDGMLLYWHLAQRFTIHLTFL